MEVASLDKLVGSNSVSDVVAVDDDSGDDGVDDGSDDGGDDGDDDDDHASSGTGAISCRVMRDRDALQRWSSSNRSDA